MEHIQRLVDEKQLDEKLKEFRTNESEEKIKLEDFGPMPEMIDDFIRNYFRNMGLNKTLATVISLGSQRLISHGRVGGRVWYHSNRLDERIYLHPISKELEYVVINVFT